MKNKIILFSGKAGTGKSTCAKYLLNLCYFDGNASVNTFSFARGVKETARRCFGWYDQKDEKGRKLLQDIGKAGRAYNEDIWVQQMHEDYLKMAVGCPDGMWGIVDDWRFPNELSYLQGTGIEVYTVRIIDSAHEILKGTPAYEDESETALDDMQDFDYVIRDAPDVEALKVEVQKIYNDLKKEI